MNEHEAIEDACANYRPLLDNGKFADITLDEMLEDIGHIYYMLRIDPKDYCFTREAIIQNETSEKFRNAYYHSKIEMRPLVNLLLDNAFKIGKLIEKYAQGLITRSKIPLESTPENDLIIGLLVRLSRDTYLGPSYYEKE